MRDVRKITTDEVREAYRGVLIPTGKSTFTVIDEDVADTEFNLWLVTERNRVAELAKEKERKRIINLIKANIGEVIWKAKTTDEPIDMSKIYDGIIEEDQ